MLAHMVYFSLHEPTAENRKIMVDACQKYLTGHPGEVFSRPARALITAAR